MKPVTSRSWQLRSPLPELSAMSALAGRLGVNLLTAQILSLRGITDPAQGLDFLEGKLAKLPDPDLLPDMEIACSRIAQALMRGEKISVHGDYDVDGISGCSLLVEALTAFGGEVEYHIPMRLKDGYGLSGEAIQRAVATGSRLLISVDCGVSAHQEARLAEELGIDLIITDHHQPSDELPVCYALINPHLPGNRFPWPDLAGVGVAFFLMLGLRRKLRQDNYFKGRTEPDLRYLLDLVALGTIADIVPLGGVNRILVKNGLPLLEQGLRSGVAALKEVAQVKQVTSGVVGFRLAPRLNAAGRLEDAALGVQLLLGKDPRACQDLARRLDGFNRERQAIEEQTLNEAIAMVEEDLRPDRHSIVLAASQWHSGVIGIVASRLVERYHRPTVLIALDQGEGKGSARSISGFHLYQALCSCAVPLMGFGGHAMAAGLSIEAAKVGEFAELFEQAARAALTPETLQPVAWHDGQISLAELTSELVRELEDLNPFGAGNPQPAFVSRACRVTGLRVLGEKHLKFNVEQGSCQLSAIAFGMADRYDQLAGQVDLLYRPGINRWRGTESLQLQVIDFKKHSEHADE